MIAFQYNKTSLQHLEKQLKMRVRTLPIIKSKESALRMEVKRCKEDMERHDEAYAAQLEQYRTLFSLWSEFDPELVKTGELIIEEKKVARNAHFPSLSLISLNSFCASSSLPKAKTTL